jgi:hypothetical protein
VTIAIRPFSGRDGDKEATDLGSAQSGIFFQERLDDPNQIESTDEIDFYAHAILGRPTRADGKTSGEIDPIYRSSGEIARCGLRGCGLRDCQNWQRDF